MTLPIGTFPIGEDITVALDVASGTVPDGLTVTAGMTPGRVVTDFEPRAGAVPVAMAVTARAESGDIPAGWNLTLAASATANLKPGIYGIDAKFAGGGATNITDTTAVIRIKRAAIA